MTQILNYISFKSSFYFYFYQYCHKCVQTYASLQEHIARLHSEGGLQPRPGSKPRPLPEQRLGCHLCERTFRSRGHLNEHISGVHERAIVVPCPMCHKTFATRKRMRKHLINSHNVRPPRNSDLLNIGSLIASSATDNEEIIQFEIVEEG